MGQFVFNLFIKHVGLKYKNVNLDGWGWKIQTH